MSSPFTEEFLPLLYNALEEEIGLYVRTDARSKLMNILYEARKLAGDPALAELRIFQIDPDVLYLAKQSTELPE